MILFDQAVFGPIHSRRLGISLGINLLPADAKICSFNCVYCECGFNTTMKEAPIPTRQDIKTMLEAKLKSMKEANEPLDVITFSGNGEPTLHTQFADIIDDTITLRNQYYPDAKVSVLSNSTRISKPDVFKALSKIDNNILKFDSAIDRTYQLIDQPVGNDKNRTVRQIIDELKKFNGNLIIQTMFIRGENNGEVFDNTTDVEVNAWLDALDEIKPKQVMIYSLDREAPVKTLQKVNVDELNVIADKARKRGYIVSVAG